MENRCREIERSIIKPIQKEIWRPFVKALNEYDMIKPGDNIAVSAFPGGRIPCFWQNVCRRNPSSWKDGIWTQIFSDEIPVTIRQTAS